MVGSIAFEIAAFLGSVAELPHDAFFFHISALFHSISQFLSALWYFGTLDLTLALTCFYNVVSFSDATDGKSQERQCNEQEISHHWKPSSYVVGQMTCAQTANSEATMYSNSIRL